jgi:hypothetical protein
MKKIIVLLLLIILLGGGVFAETWAYIGGVSLGLGATGLIAGLVSENHPAPLIVTGIGFSLLGVIFIIVDILDKDPNSSAYNSEYSVETSKNPIVSHLRMGMTDDLLYLGVSF